jgi:hypothetical protein
MKMKKEPTVQHKHLTGNAAKPIVMRRFANARHSCAATWEDSWFHIVKADGWTAYIEEFEDEVLLSWFNSKQMMSGPTEHKSLDEALDKVEGYVLANCA